MLIVLDELGDDPVSYTHLDVYKRQVATPIELNISLEEVFLRSQARYKCYLPGRFVCFSPETFVRIVEMCIRDRV